MLVTVTTETYLFSQMSEALNVIPPFVPHSHTRTCIHYLKVACFFPTYSPIEFKCMFCLKRNGFFFSKLACYVAAA